MRAFLLALALAAFSTSASAEPREAEVSPGVVVLFLDEAGPCVGGAKLAIYIDGAQRIPGCYREEGPIIGIAFLDADTMRVPKSMLRRAKDA